MIGAKSTPLWSVAAINPTCLQNVNTSLPILGRRIGIMPIYPVPVAVTQARVQLLVDQTAKAPPQTINHDVLDVLAVQNQAEREALLDRKA
jgi:hypothetical protein